MRQGGRARSRAALLARVSTYLDWDLAVVQVDDNDVAVLGALAVLGLLLGQHVQSGAFEL